MTWMILLCCGVHPVTALYIRGAANALYGCLLRREVALSGPSSLVKTALRWLIRVTAVLGVLYLLLAAIGLMWTPYTCLTDVRERIVGLAGFDFEISETSCSTIAKDDAVSVFVSKAGQGSKALLFKYVPTYIGPYPIVTSIDERTVRISVSRVSSLFCLRDEWETLTVKYDIGSVTYPDSRPRPDECQ